MSLKNRSAIKIAGIATAVAALLSLTGCGTTDSSLTASPAGNSGRQAAEPAGTSSTGGDSASGRPDSRFVACLQAAGFDARINDDGWVGARYDVPIAYGSSSVTLADGFDAAWRDHTGLTWAAPTTPDSFETDPDLAAAWRDCEAQVPDFQQITWNDVEGSVSLTADSVTEGQLAFAQRARNAGFEWVADPTPWMGTAIGFIEIPSWVTAQEFTSLLEAAFNPADPNWVLFAGNPGFSVTDILSQFAPNGGLAWFPGF